MRRPITLALLLVEAGTLSAVAVMPVRLFVDGALVAEGEVRVADLDQSYLIVSHGETGTRLELIQP